MEAHTPPKMIQSEAAVQNETTDAQGLPADPDRRAGRARHARTRGLVRGGGGMQRPGNKLDLGHRVSLARVGFLALTSQTDTKAQVGGNVGKCSHKYN